MARKILVGVGAVLLLLVLVVATRPGDFRIERSLAMNAPPDAVFAQVNDFHKWEAWSPWEKLDPKMQKVFDGAPAGTGAIYAWTGNDKAGEGRMTIEKSDKPSRVDIKLEFLKPFAATNATSFVFTPTPAGTNVVWTMTGHNGFMAKAFSMFMDMDKLVGGDFEKGLASLKAVAEASPKAP